MWGELSHTRRAAAPAEAWPPSWQPSPLAAVALVACGGRRSPRCWCRALTQCLPPQHPYSPPRGVLLSLPTWARPGLHPSHLPSQQQPAVCFQMR